MKRFYYLLIYLLTYLCFYDKLHYQFKNFKLTLHPSNKLHSSYVILLVRFLFQHAKFCLKLLPTKDFAP